MAKELTLAQQQADRKERAKNLATSMSKDGLKITYAANLKDKGRQSFGYKELDELTGGGIKRGVPSVIWGEKGSGKSTIAERLGAQAQREGKIVLWIDMERSFDSYWAVKQGMNMDTLLYVKCITAEQALDTIIQYCSKKLVDVIILDSIHGLSVKGEQFEGKTAIIKSTEKDTQAALARKLSQFFRMAIPYISDSDCAFLLIGQSRSSVGMFAIEQLTGGRALKFYSRAILHVWEGKGEDAPTEEIITYIPKVDKEGVPDLDKDGHPKMVKSKKLKKIGFSLVIKVDKSQMQGCLPLSEIRVPFYFATGLDKPIEETKIESIIPNVNEVLKESIEIGKQLEEVSGLPTEPKKKRGRPATKGK